MANVRVALRVRPLSKRENGEESRVILNVDEKIVRIRNVKLDYKPEIGGDTRERLLEFGFDYCYWSVDPEDPKYASQEVIFQDLGTTVLSEAIKGYNVCLFAYGQTGSGKTYTMMGTPASIGLTPRICEGLFNYNDGSPGTPSSSRIEVSFLEIYNERVRDLLHQSEQKKPYTLRVREHPEKGPYVQGLSQHVVTDYEQVVALLEQGMENRITAATHVHDASSRSHAIFTIHYTQAMLEDNLPSEIASKINLVDLAGSERASPNYCKDRLTEGSNINRSLVTLGIVISALAQNSQMSSSCQSINSILSDGDSGIPSSPAGSKRQPFVPYRDSILTWLLKDSLGGNSKTIMIATVSPASSSYNETMSTLRYASNAKNIINKPRVNEDANVKLIRELREEINRLKAMLRNFEMRTISPSFSEERDGNLTELVLQNELKIEQLTRDWTDKWSDKAALMEQYNVDIKEGKARVTIDSGLPHLIAMDDDILSTGVVIYYLREGTTNIGSGDHDIVLQGEDIGQEHCIIENKLGVVELRPTLGAICTVNGQEVTDVCRLSQGAVIVLGKSHRFRFNHPAEAAVLRQMRSDSQASFVSEGSLDWLDLSGDFSSSSKGNSLTLNTRNSESPSEDYQQGLRELEATYRKQIEEQQLYVEDLKSQIQTAQAKGEKELEHEQSLINQQTQEYQQWLVKEKERLGALCHQKRESSSQTEPKTYVEVEVQNCVQTDIQPSLEEQEGKKLVQLELLRKCSLRRAERNIRRKRVKLQLERIVKKQKLLEAKKTLQQLQAACWLSDDIVKPTLSHVPKVQETTALHRSRSSPSGFSSYRRCSLPWTLPQLPNSYSAVLKRKCKSELAQTTKTDDVRNPLRSASIDCLLNSSAIPGSNGESDINPPNINTKYLQFFDEERINLHIKQGAAVATLSSIDLQMSKKRLKMDKPKVGSKGSSNNVTAEQPKRRNLRATVSTAAKDSKLKTLKSPSPMTASGLKKYTVPEKGKTSPKSDIVKLPPQKSVKHTQISPGQAKPPSGESMLKSKPTRYNIAPVKSLAQRKPTEQSKKVSSVGNTSKVSNRRGENPTNDRGRISTDRLGRVLPKTNNIRTLGGNKRDDHSDSSDSESFYSVDSLSSAYASVLTEQLKQEELQRQRSHKGHRESDSDDSQISQDSLAEKDKRKERPNKRRFNKYKTIGATSTNAAFRGDHNSFPLVTTGSVTAGLTKSFSLDSLADAEDVLEVDSAEELPAEIFWKLQSPRNLILNEEDQNKENCEVVREDGDLDSSSSFYLKGNDGSVPDNCSVTIHGKTDYHAATPLAVCDGRSQTISLPRDIACGSSELFNKIDTLRPNVIIVHGNAASPDSAPTLGPKVGEDVINLICTNENVAGIDPKQFASQLDAPLLKPEQHTCSYSAPHIETQNRPANKSTITKMSQEEKRHDSCLLECSNFDKRYSADKDSPPVLTKCEINEPLSECKDNLESPLETPVSYILMKESEGDEQSKTKVDPIGSKNVTNIVENLCPIKLQEIPIVDHMKKCEETQNNLHPNKKNENTNSAMPGSSRPHVENLHEQQQSPICQKSILSEPLCCESHDNNTSMSNVKGDDQLIYCDSKAIQLKSQSQRFPVEQEINANTGGKTETPTNFVQETKDESEQYSVQTHGTCEHGEMLSAGNTNHSADDGGVDKNILLPIHHSSHLQHKGEITTSSPTSPTSRPTKFDQNIHSASQEVKRNSSTQNPAILVDPSPLSQEVCRKSEKPDVEVREPFPDTKLNYHLISDDCMDVVAECNSRISNENTEGLCFALEVDGTLDENVYMADFAENSSSMKSVPKRDSTRSPDNVLHCIQAKSEDLDNAKDKVKENSQSSERMLPKNNFSRNDESENLLANSCSVCQRSSESNDTTSFVFCSKCTRNKSQINDEGLPIIQPKEIQLSLENAQIKRAGNVKDEQSHLEASEQIYVSKIDNQSSSRDLSTDDSTQSYFSKDEGPLTSYKTYPSCLNERFPLKNSKLTKFKDINCNDDVSFGNDFSYLKDFLSGSDDWKHCNSPENNREDTSIGTRQQEDDSFNHYLVEGRNGPYQPLPYYEANMQNKHFIKIKQKNENMDQDMFSNNAKETLASKQTGLNITFPCTTEKDATGIDNVLKVDSLQCSTSHKGTEEERTDYKPQTGAPEQSTLYKTRGCGPEADLPHAIAKPRVGTELNHTTCTKSNISKYSLLQGKYGSTEEQLHNDDRTREDISLQLNTHKCANLSEKNRDECGTVIEDACILQYKSGPRTTQEDYTTLQSIDARALSNTTSSNLPKCNTKRDAGQDAPSDFLNEKNEECTTTNNYADSEMLALFRDKICSGHGIEDHMYQPATPHIMSADGFSGEPTTDMTAGSSSGIPYTKTCKVSCEMKGLCDHNIPVHDQINKVNGSVTCAVDQSGSPVRDNDQPMEKCLTTRVCGEYSPDLSESTDVSSSDTDTSRYLVLRKVPSTKLQNNIIEVLTEDESQSPMSKETPYSSEEMSPCTESIETSSPEHPNNMDSSESHMNAIDLSTVLVTPSRVNGHLMAEDVNPNIISEVDAQQNVADHSIQTVQYSPPTIVSNVLMEGGGNKSYLTKKPQDGHLRNFIANPLHQAVDVVDNTEGLHFSSSDINPFVHSWQQEENPKPSWRNCTFNSASDVSRAKCREQAAKLIRCSSVDEGLNSHNSPFYSHLSSYAKPVSSTISSLGRNDSRPDITSLDDSQELSDESAVMCTGNRPEFTELSVLQTKLEDYSQLDEIIFLYTSESESYTEPVKRVSVEQGTHKHKHRKTSKHQRSHTDVSSSRQMRSRNAYQRPASWSSVQSMSLHLSQLLQETSELLGNLSKHNPENVSTDTFKIQRDSEEQILKRSVRDSSTQTAVDKGIQTDSQMVNNGQQHGWEPSHYLNSSGINVIVKVLGTDSLSHIPQNTGVTEQSNSKVTKTRTQSLPNLNEIEPCKQSEHVSFHSPQVHASTPFLTGLQDLPSTAIPCSSSKSSSISTNVNKCADDTVVNSPSSSVVNSTGYHISYHEKTSMVDRASSPILTVKASKKFHHKLVPESHLNNQNFVKILRNRKRKERELRDLQVNSSQTETDSESNAGNEYKATRSSSLKESTRKRVSTAKVQRFVSEGCILPGTCSSFTNHSSSNSEITGSGRRCSGGNYFTSTDLGKAPQPWEHLQSLQNLSLIPQPVTYQNEQMPSQSVKELPSDKNDVGSFTVTSSNLYMKNRSYPYSPSQVSGIGLHLQEDGLSVVESECNTDILLGQDPTFRASQIHHSYALHDLPMHNKFSNWSGVQGSSTRSGMVSSSPNLNVRSPARNETSQEALESRSQEIERLQRERAEVLSAIHLEMNPLPLTVQLAEAKLSYGIGETDALLRVLQTGKMDPQDTGSIKKQLYDRHMKVIENLRKEREERLHIFRRSRSLSPQKQLSASQTSLTSLKEFDLPSRRREYLQQLRRDVVDHTRIQVPKSRSQCPSEIEVMLKDYQKAREEAKTEIAKARDKLRERAEMERRRLQQGSLSKDDTKMTTLVSTSTLFSNSSLSLSSGPTSGYNSGMTATIGQSSKIGSQEILPRSLDPAVGTGRGRSGVRNCDLFTPTDILVPDPHITSYTLKMEDVLGKSPQRDPLLQSPASYQDLATQVQASAMAEVMTASSYDIKMLYSRQAAAGWIYQSTEKDVLVYYKAFASATKHGFLGAGVIKRPLHDVWCVVKDIDTRRLYDQSILTAHVHERVGSNVQLVHVMTDTSLCYLKQPRDFCCMAVEYKQEKCYSLCFQSVYNESMPRPNKDTVRGELLPSAWILQPDTINGEAVTRVIYMIQVDLGAPAIPSRLLSVISKRQPLVIANLASYLCR
ncbi:hypothetical protein GDO81_015186 [Engystomops pustulosus]|uniref:StAR-related lipid transfer protein 9 n=1 Tax=Engystomops pustulosus TaxID=76066 RepID=A0AAV7AHD8_ENGPU|nr:hypothetical protein GDO81_015186 [Engystomops pustulosus]KAG8560935.1 hypothetical protein GDO81_015186 [Engystomops pustulosus]